MLIIFDNKNRKNGIKEYLEQGENHDRDIKDSRVTLFGDIELLSQAIKQANNKKYSHSYRSIVLSFSEDDIKKDILEQIASDFIKKYVSGYSSDEYVAYVEAHYPKIKTNSKGATRKPHIHIAIAMYNPKLDKLLQLGTHATRAEELRLWKELTEQRYNLKSARQNPLRQEPRRKPKRKKLIDSVNSYIKSNIKRVHSFEELKALLANEFGFEVLKESTPKAKNSYITVLTHQNEKMRLKGELYSLTTFNRARELLINEPKKSYINHTQKVAKIDREKLDRYNFLSKRRVEYITKIEASKRAKVVNYFEDIFKIELPKPTKTKQKSQNRDSKTKTVIQERLKELNQQEQIEKIDLREIKRYLNTTYLFESIKDKYRLNRELYKAFFDSDKQEYKIAIGNRALSVVDFFTQELHEDLKTTMEELERIYKGQLGQGSRVEIQGNRGFKMGI